MSSLQIDLELFNALASPIFPRGECPICLVSLPHSSTNAIHPYTHLVCCGQVICFGCYYKYNVKSKKECALCRSPTATSRQETIQRGNVRIESGDKEAIMARACDFQRGINGMDVDLEEANKLFVKGANLGSVDCLHEVALALLQGDDFGSELGLEYLTIVADVYKHPAANLTLGTINEAAARIKNCNDHYKIAINYYINAAEYGIELACTKLRGLYKDGFTTKDELMTSLRSYQNYVELVKTEERDEVAKVTNQGKYY